MNSLQIDSQQLTQIERELLSHSLFTFCMKVGPAGFKNFESIAQKTGVLKEFLEDAKSWIDYSKKNPKRDEAT